MRRYVYTNDFLFHGQREAPGVFHEELYRLLSVPFEAGLKSPLLNIADFTGDSGARFSREAFYASSGIRGIGNSYYLYDFRAIKGRSWDYFRSVFPQDTVFVGCELGLDLREKLTELGYVYVNFWFHPYKLLDDIFFLVGSNDRKVFERIERFRVPMDRLRFYASYYSVLAERKGFLANLPIEDNCCLFAGQTFADKSVERDGKFLNITDFADRIEQEARRFSKIYYIPHPTATANREVDEYLARTPAVQLLSGVPTYYMLASPKVRKVMALSSSILYEAETFGKEVEYLYRPLFEIDAPFSLNAFVSVYQSYFAPSFWQVVLGGADFRSGAGDILLDENSGKFRDMLGYPFGFRYLGRLERADDRVSGLEKGAVADHAAISALSSRQSELAARLGELAARQGELAARQERDYQLMVGLNEGLRSIADWSNRVRGNIAYRLARRLKWLLGK